MLSLLPSNAFLPRRSHQIVWLSRFSNGTLFFFLSPAYLKVIIIEERSNGEMVVIQEVKKWDQIRRVTGEGCVSGWKYCGYRKRRNTAANSKNAGKKLKSQRRPHQQQQRNIEILCVCVRACAHWIRRMIHFHIERTLSFWVFFHTDVVCVCSSVYITHTIRAFYSNLCTFLLVPSLNGYIPLIQRSSQDLLACQFLLSLSPFFFSSSC